MSLPAKNVRSSCPICGPYVVEATATTIAPGIVNLEIPQDYAERHAQDDNHIFLSEMKRAYHEATHWVQKGVG